MNTLSVLIYLAEVTGRAGTLASIALFATLAILVVCMIAYAVAEEKIFPYIGRFVFALVVLALLATFIPSSRTVYLIAASEMGETVITNPQAQQLFEKLRERIERELEKDKKEEKSDKL